MNFGNTQVAYFVAALFFIKLLMRFLGTIKWRGRRNECSCRSLEDTGITDLRQRLAGDSVLVGIECKDLRAILALIAFRITPSGIVAAPENIQQLAVADATGIVADAYCLGMAGRVTAHIGIGRI